MAAKEPRETVADETFEQGLKLLRDAFSQRTAAKDAEISRLRGELGRRDAKIEELQKKVARLIDDLQKATQQNTSLSLEVSRLYAFRQNILESFDDRDLSELQRASKSGTSAALAAMAGVSSSSASAMPTSASKHKDDPFSAYESEKNSNGFAHLDSRKPFGTKDSTAHETFDVRSEDSEFEVTTRKSHSTSKPVVVDGKDFFNRARERLSYDKFNSLLAHIQRYNRRERTKDETLEALSTLLETKYHDLYESFEAMVSQ